jgi:hypothetical protein
VSRTTGSARFFCCPRPTEIQQAHHTFLPSLRTLLLHARRPDQHNHMQRIHLEISRLQ